MTGTPGGSRSEIALDGSADIGQQPLELAVRARRIRKLQALLELVGIEAAVAGRPAERQDRALAVGV